MTESQNITPPDGGWGYACVLGLAICQFLFGMVARSFGVIYLITLENFETTATVTAWIGGFYSIVWGAFCPIASMLCQKYGARKVVNVGTILTFIGYIITAFSTHIAMLYVSYGIFAGIGTACLSSCSYIIVSQYFDKKRALATSVGSTGGSFGVLVTPPLISFMAYYYGYQGCMLISAAICLEGFVSAALFRPLEPSPKAHKTNNSVPTVKETELEKEHENKLHEQYKQGVKHRLEPHWTDSIESGINLDAKYQSNPNVNQPDDEKNQKVCCSKLRKIFRMLLDEPTIIGVILINAGITFGATTLSTFGPALAVDAGIPQIYAVLLLTWNGVTDFICRIILGFIMDMKAVRSYRLHVYTLCSTMAAVSLIFFPFIPGNYLWYTMVGVTSNLFIGTVVAQRTTVAADILGLKRMPLVFGILQLVNSLGMTAGRGIGGLFRDSFGNYSYIFYVSGVFGLCCNSAMYILMFIDKRSRKDKKDKEYKTVNAR